MENVLTKFFQKPMNCCATSSSLVAVTLPVENPVPTGCSTQTTLVNRFHAQGLGTGWNVPYCQLCVGQTLYVRNTTRTEFHVQERAVLLEEPFEGGATGLDG